MKKVKLIQSVAQTSDRQRKGEEYAKPRQLRQRSVQPSLYTFLWFGCKNESLLVVILQNEPNFKILKIIKLERDWDFIMCSLSMSGALKNPRALFYL